MGTTSHAPIQEASTPKVWATAAGPIQGASTPQSWSMQQAAPCCLYKAGSPLAGGTANNAP
eukprot:scaffold110220_cov20-Tisochrysis_lutea.AAC.1